MYLDANLEMADNVSIAAAAGTALIGDGVAIPDAGAEVNFSRNLFVVISLSEEIVSAGAATVQFRVVSDDSAAPSTTTSTQHAETGPIPYATLNSAKRVIIPLPEGPLAYEEYIGVLCVTGTATTTAGKINAFITTDPGRWTAVADGL